MGAENSKEKEKEKHSTKSVHHLGDKKGKHHEIKLIGQFKNSNCPTPKPQGHYCEPKNRFMQEQCESEYEQVFKRCKQQYSLHRIDTAYELARRCLKYNPSKKDELGFLHRIIAEYDKVIELEKQLTKEGWVEQKSQIGKVKTRRENDGTISIHAVRELLIPFEHVVAILTQFDEIDKLVPMVVNTKLMKKVQRNCRIGWTVNKLPIIAPRQAHFIAYGFDRLDQTSQIFMFQHSLADMPHLYERYDYTPKVDPDTVQLVYKYLLVLYEPVSEGKGNLTIASNIDSKLNFVPVFIMEWFIIHNLNNMFQKFDQISANFDGTAWEKKVRQDSTTIDFFKNLTLRHLQKKGSEMRPN